MINLLGVKYSFWGCISGKIAHRACQLGATDIMYIGKLGALTQVEDVYQKIFSPTQYFTLHYNKILNRAKPHNPIVAYFPQLDSKVHISVPTVVEEDYVQRAYIDGLKGQSIDNEIAQMAFAIQAFNKKNQANVTFSPLHFATDYVRKATEKSLFTPLHLGNNRSLNAKKAKHRMLATIGEYVVDYFNKLTHESSF